MMTRPLGNADLYSPRQPLHPSPAAAQSVPHFADPRFRAEILRHSPGLARQGAESPAPSRPRSGSWRFAVSSRSQGQFDPDDLYARRTFSTEGTWSTRSIWSLDL